MLDEELPSALELEEYLQNGVLLCKLAMKLLPDEPMWKKVYDLDQAKFKVHTCTCTCTDQIKNIVWMAHT